MNLQQLAVLTELELNRVTALLRRKGDLVKDFAAINPDADKLRTLHVEMAFIVEGLGVEGRELLIKYRPDWKNFVETMLDLADAERATMAKFIADKKAQLATPATEDDSDGK